MTSLMQCTRHCQSIYVYNLCSILPTTHTEEEGVKDAGQTLAGESKLRPLPRPPSHTPLIAAASQKLLEELSSKLDGSVEGDGKSEPTSNGVVVEGGREKGETRKEWRKSLPVSDMIETLDSSSPRLGGRSARRVSV